MTNQVKRLTHDDLLVILARASYFDDWEDSKTRSSVTQRCKRFRETIPEIVKKLELDRHK